MDEYISKKDVENLLGNTIAEWEILRKIEELPVVEVPQWVSVSERMPEEHEWIGTEKFGTTISDEVYVTFETPNGERFAKHLSFQNGKLADFEQRRIDTFYKGSVPIAWMPLPEPYKENDDG